MACPFLPFLSQISGEAELSQPAWRCTGGAVYSRVGTTLGVPSISHVRHQAPVLGGWRGQTVHLLVSGVRIAATKGQPQTCLTSPPSPCSSSSNWQRFGRWPRRSKAFLKSAQAPLFAHLASGKGYSVAVPSPVFGHVSGLCCGSRSQDSGR